MSKLRTVAAIAATWVLMGAWTTASAISLELVADNQRSSSGTLSTLAWKFSGCNSCSAIGNGYYRATNSWYIANGVSPGDALWDWSGGVLTKTGTGVFQSTSFVSSNAAGSSVISDRTTGMVINTNTSTTTATTYNCIEGVFLAFVGANGCLNTSLGGDAANSSSAAYNVGGDANCVNRTIGGDDSSTGNVRTLMSPVTGGGCDAGDGAYNLWTVVTDTTSSGAGGTLVISNGIAIGSPNTHYMTFTVVPVPAAAWLFGSALGLLGLARRRAGSPA